MKKTLIALAVLAASGASFAQVTITGNLAMGYRAGTTGVAAGGTTAGADFAGFGTDTSQINFAATEDLGGGMKVTAKMALAGADRSGESGTAGAVTGRDATLSLQTNVGVFTLGSVSSPDYLSGTVAGVGAYYNGWDGKIFSARTNRDVLVYSLPIDAWTLATSYQESSGATEQGLGVGTTGNYVLAGGATAMAGQSVTTYGASYAKGAIAGNFTYLNFNSPVGGTKNQTRLSGSYDLGMAKLGLGAVVTNNDSAAAGSLGATASPKITDMLFGVSVPLGSLTLGLELAQRRTDDFVAAASGTRTGASLQAAYALSKRTSMIANYARWDGTVGNAVQSSQTNLLLSHSF